MTGYKRREIILVNLYPKKGTEIGKTRPAIILSDDIDNEELETMIVLPLSTQLIDDVMKEDRRKKEWQGEEWIGMTIEEIASEIYTNPIWERNLREAGG